MHIDAKRAASSSTAAIAVSANGTALPGAYSIKVNALAQEQRNYSSPFATMNEALGQTGTLSLQVGTGTAVNVDVTASDTLDGIAAKINASGARLSASIFSDGTSYRVSAVRLYRPVLPGHGQEVAYQAFHKEGS